MTKQIEVTQADIALRDALESVGFGDEGGNAVLPEVALQMLARHRIAHTRSQPSDSVVEAMARASCEWEGRNPDEIMPDDRPRWKDRVECMEQVLKAVPAQPRDDVEADLAACDRAIERMGWLEIQAFMAEPGQSPYEDAGGYLLRKIKRLFGIKPDRLETYREAAERLVAEARAQGGGSHHIDAHLNG